MTTSRGQDPLKSTRPRLREPMAESVLRYTASVGYDQRLAMQDIAGSVAHARMLGKQGIITHKEAGDLIRGLLSIKDELASGSFPFRDDLEDIHMNIEARLAEQVGDIAGKLHTARSRNDQVALDLRLYLKDAIRETILRVCGLQHVLIDQAEGCVDAILPGYTHLQRAQPVLLAHHLLAYFHMLQRDIERFQGCRQRADIMPLGSGALAGLPYPLDRESVAMELGFSRISANSMDAVSDRDFVLEFHSAACVAMMHLSRLAEEVVLWCSAEFGFLELNDAYSTGSSIMPQKKNPDAAELARGKTGRVYGNLMAALTMMKALPLAYNRDLQEDKEGLFDTVDTLNSTLEVFAGMLATATFKLDRMLEAAKSGYTLATDVADYLSKKGVPFRDAHRIVANVVEYANEVGKDLPDLTLEEYSRFSDQFDADVKDITEEQSVAAREVPGGTGPKQVKRQLQDARGMLEKALPAPPSSTLAESERPQWTAARGQQ